MNLAFWILIFVVSVIALVKGADYFILGAEKIGLALGLSSFIVGVVIVGLGTSLPELVSSLSAVIQRTSEIVVANAIGSNIFNILVIIGISALLSGSFLKVERSLIDLDLPLLAISSVVVFGILIDGSVNIYEGMLLLLLYLIYFVYAIRYFPQQEEENKLPSRVERRNRLASFKDKVSWKEFLFLILGASLLVVGADYVVKSIIKISEVLSLSPGVIAIIGLAVGTSLPELAVSVRASMKKKYEIAIGNIFGSNIFNGLMVIGIPALISNLKVGPQTLSIALPVFLASTFLFVISGISQRIHKWEGAMYLVFYIFFIAKLFALF